MPNKIDNYLISPPTYEFATHKVLMRMVDEEDGPFSSYGISEQEQRSLDSTCRRFHRFLQESMAPPQ